MSSKNLKRKSFFLLLSLVFLTGVALFKAKEIKIDYDFERFFPANDSNLVQYLEYSKQFQQKDDAFILVGIKNEAGVFDEKFLKKLEKCGNKIAQLNNVLKVLSPCHNCFYIKDAGLSGFEEKPCIGFLNFVEDSIRIFSDKKLPGSIFSKESPTVSLYINIEQNINKAEGEKVLTEIKLILEQENFDELHIAGKISTVAHYTSKMKNELVFFFIASLVLVCIFLWLSYKTWWAVLIPLCIILGSIIWTLSIMVLTGKDLDILMVMLPTIIFVVGMSDLIHFLNRYLEELRLGNEKLAAIKTSFKEIGLATLLTSLTTAIGFFSLLAVEIIPVQEFGIYSGISVLVAYILSFCSLPLMLIFLPIPQNLALKKRSLKWRFFMNKCFVWVIRNKGSLAIGSLVLFVLGIYSSSLLRVNTFMIEDLQENDPLKISYRFFENNFSGVRPVEIYLEKGDSARKILDYSVAKEIVKLEEYLENRYTEKGIGFMISPIDPIKYVYSIKHNNNPRYFKLPGEKPYNNALNLIKSLNTQQLNNHFISPDSNKARISGKIHDVGSFVMKEENKKLMQFISDSINSNLLHIRLTGTAMLLDKNNEKLSSNILLGLIVAFGIISVIIGAIYRSWIIVLIALIVNILPLTLITMVMNFFQFDIKTSTALIFTLAFGIAVDDTIHLLSKLKLEIGKRKSILWALKSSYLSTGKAIVVTSLILCGGFLTLIASDFTSVFSMGLLISITLFLAVVIDLTLLPSLLILSHKKLQKKTNRLNRSSDSNSAKI